MKEVPSQGGKVAWSIVSKDVISYKWSLRSGAFHLHGILFQKQMYLHPRSFEADQLYGLWQPFN